VRTGFRFVASVEPLSSTFFGACDVNLPFHQFVLLFVFVICATSGHLLLAQERQTTQSILDFKKLSVRDLMDIEVTSVSRSAEQLGEAAAAVTVVTGEDIRRVGATSLPEALRMVPGIHVARQSANIWAVGSRGFSNVNSEKLLVLTDTRSIYTPLFSGVFWDVQDYLLQDIDRVEVIRGPGATLWGSNAVNGVINITTKSAKNTQGLYLETSAGTEEHGAVGARFGGRIGDRAYYRVFGKYFERDDSFHTRPASPDTWETGHLGFRADVEATERDTLTIQADAYRADVGRLTPSVVVAGRPEPLGRLRVRPAGGNVLARWRHSRSDDSEVQFRFYYDRTHRNDPSFIDDLHTLDFDVQHRWAVGSRHEVTWGSNYHFMANRNAGRGVFAVEPTYSGDHLVAGFIQDQIRFLDSVRLTVGTKLEHNDFSGVEVQPSGRVAWELVSNQTLWGAISRAARVPTRLERDIAIDVTDPQRTPLYRLLGNAAFDSERLLAYEAGYRWQAQRAFSIDVAAFFNRYRGLASLEMGSPFVDPVRGKAVIPLRYQNLNAGRAAGAEVLVTYAPLTTSRFTASYSNLDMSLHAAGQDINRGTTIDGGTPRHQFGLRASQDLPAGFQLDAMFRHLSAIRRIPLAVTAEGVPGYPELDLRFAWIGWNKAEISLIGQNLLHRHHPEFGTSAVRGEIDRGVYAKIAWGF
jgi:iron complex outermembrane recepter protein